MKHFFAALMVQILLICLTITTTNTNAQQNVLCRVVGGSIFDAPNDPCFDYKDFIPNDHSDTIVLRVAVNIKNQGTDPNAPINHMDDTTFYNWVQRASDLYGHIAPAVYNVPGTEYISDTKIRFMLVGVYRDQGGVPYPTNPHAIKLSIYAGTNGYGIDGGYASAFPDSQSVKFYMDIADFVDHGPTISYREKWLGHELGHIMGVLHPDGRARLYTRL